MAADEECRLKKIRLEIVSGVRHGYTLGSPIALVVKNNDWKHWTKIMGAEAISSRDKRMKLNEKLPVPDQAMLI